MAQKIDVSTIQDLLDYVQENGTAVYRRANEIKMNMEDGTIGFRIEGHDGDEPYDYRWYEISKIALRGLAHQFDIPIRYITECPVDLAAININYWASRSDRELTFSLTEGIVSEVKSTESDRTIQEILSQVQEALASDEVRIDQVDMRASMIRFMAYLPDEEQSELGSIHRGVSVEAPISKSRKVRVDPILFDEQTGTATAIGVRVPKDLDEKDLPSMLALAVEHLSELESVVLNNRSNPIHDSHHFVARYGKKVGLTTVNKKKALEEVMLVENRTAITVARAVMNSQEKTRSSLAVIKAARLAGEAFYAVDPVYCQQCHQEIDEDETKDPDELD